MVVAIVEGLRLPDFLFLTVIFWCALTVLRMARDAARRARTERRRAHRLATTPVDDVARRAVAEERVRLAADIEAVIRASVTTMGEYARSARRRWDTDPEPSLVGIQDEGRRAATELRRLLGLLREAEAGTDQPAPAAERHPARLDILLGLAAAALSVAERYPVAPDVPAAMHTTTSLVLTALAAATIALRRSAPAVGATICGALFATSAISGDPVSPGFWILLTPATLAWSAMAARTWYGAGGMAALIAGIVADLGRYNAVNLPISVAIIGVAGAGGAFVGWSNQRRAAAYEQVVRRSAELDAAAEHAVRGERLAVARDLHDVVSHAVAVMVMQAGAAEALRVSDPPGARTALALVDRTAADTLGELDRLVAAIAAGTMGVAMPAAGAVDRDTDDLRALLHRMRAAGLRISADLRGGVSGPTGAVVYRIVQEALTNAVRHAPGAQVTVLVDPSARDVTIEVTDDGPGPGGGSRRGYGLVGIAERVERIGGQLHTGPAAHRTGFRVSARLPVIGTVTT
jgi:signal transduction histidine kinase